MAHLRHFPDQKNARILKTITQSIQSLPLHRPTITAISGPAGVGKTTLAENVRVGLGKENCLLLDLDDYQYSREEKRNLGVSGHHPGGTKIDKARADIQGLCQERSVVKPRYDFITGEIFEGGIALPKRHIIICGVSALFEGLRELSDFSILMEIPEDRLLQIKLERDVKERGYSPERVIEYFNELQKDHERYIAPVRDSVSMVLEVGEGHELVSGVAT